MFDSVFFKSTKFCGTFSNMSNFICKKIKRFGQVVMLGQLNEVIRF